MRNIVIYTTKKQSDIKDTLEHLDNIDELQIRVELSEDLKEYVALGGSLFELEASKVYELINNKTSTTDDK